MLSLECQSCGCCACAGHQLLAAAFQPSKACTHRPRAGWQAMLQPHTCFCLPWMSFTGMSM